MAGLIVNGMLAANAYAVDLMQMYQQALANDPIYTSARYALRANNEASVQGRARLLPTIGIGGNDSRSEESWRASNSTYRLQLTQPLFRPAYWQQYQESKLSVASGEIKFAQARQDLMLRVSQAYFDILAAQDVLASLHAQKSAITEQLASAQRNFEVGTATITDTNEAQASYDLVVAQEIAASNSLEVARNALQQIIGKPPAPLAILRPDIQLTLPQPTVIESWVSRAAQQSLSVIDQELALDTAKYEIRKNRACHLPTVDLAVSREHSDISGSVSYWNNRSQMSNSISIQWNIPLYAGGAVDSSVRQAVASEDKARSDLENARRMAALNARQAYLGVSNGLAQVKAYEAAELSSQSSLDANRLGYQVGVRVNVDVLNAQKQLFSTRRDLAKARYDTVMSGLKLKVAIGTLKEEDLQQINLQLMQENN